jgi:hypothetical protein
MTLPTRSPSSDYTSIDIDIDPRAQRMRGVTVIGNISFDLPVISHVTDNLWVGGSSRELSLPYEIRHVVCLSPWTAYTRTHLLDSYLEVTMYDDPTKKPDVGLIRYLADHVNIVSDRAYRGEEPAPQVEGGGQVLVHCQAGLNRSNLILGTALIRRGFDPGDAIALISAVRGPAALCNEAFREFLYEDAL